MSKQTGSRFYQWWAGELSGRYLFPGVTGGLGFFLGLASAPPTDRFWPWTAIVTMFCLMLGWFVDDILRWHLKDRRIDENLEKIRKRLDDLKDRRIDNNVEWIKEHMEGLAVSHNLHTDSNFMEEFLKRSEGMKGRVRWLVPLFLSEKFSQELADRDAIKLDLDEHGYTRFLEKLIPYCSTSIMMTCTHPPARWLERLLPSDKLAHALAGNMRFEDFPQHAQRLLTLSDVTKQRLVIIQQDDLDSFLVNIDPLIAFMKCCNSSYNIDTKFVYQPKLCYKCGKTKMCDNVWKRDFQIWDGAISVEYERGETAELVELRVEPSKDFKLFKPWCWSRADNTCAYSLEKMQELVDLVKDSGQRERLQRWELSKRPGGPVEREIWLGPAVVGSETISGQREE